MNQELYDEIKKQLSPIFLKFYKTSDTYKKFGESAPQLSNSVMKTNQIGRDLTELQFIMNTKDIALKYKGLMAAFSYLLRVEIIATFFIDLTLLLLIDERVCLHLDPDDNHKFVRHASSLEDIESTSLSLYRKIDFLETNKITLFEDYIDRELRNKIAHGNFIVEEDGKFYTISAKGNKNEIDLKKKLLQLDDFIEAILQVFSEELAKTDSLPVRPRD